MAMIPTSTRKQMSSVAWLVVWLIILTIYLFPFIWMVMTGFRKPVDTYSWPPKFIFSPTLDGFEYLFSYRNFQGYLINSVIVSVISTALVVALGTPAAYAAAHLNFSKRGFLLSLLIGRMMPAIALVVPIYLIAAKWHQLDTYRILIAVNVAFNLPFTIWFTRGFFLDVPKELREAAIIDGCSEFQVFRIVFLPLAAGGIIAAAVFGFIASWNEFLFALALTNTRAATAPIAALSFRTQYGIQWGAAGAAALLISVPVIIFAIAMQRYLVRGLTLGAVK